jgi:hypothetical protein
VAKVGTHRRHPPRDRRAREPVGSHGCKPALETLGRDVGDRLAGERVQRGEVAPVRVDGTRRPAGLKVEQEALDVGIGGSHGARTVSSAGRPLLRAVLVLVAVTAAFAALPSLASASQLIARNTSSERIEVSSSGRAVITYHGQGRLQHVLVWGAVNARPPTPEVPQSRFRIDYSGGWRSHGKAVWRTPRSVCSAYRGPQLPYLVAACTARDGSHWALQKWERSQANFGLPPWKAGHAAWELRVSHWTGPLAKVDAWLDWSYGGRWHHLFGRLTYRGAPVFGFATTPSGQPLDGYGRVVYADTLDSAYGKGWRRENAFVARNPDGTFCYGFVPHVAADGERRPPGNGRRYRVAVSGPGVTPDVVWEGAGLADFDRRNPDDVAYEARMNALQRTLMARSSPCRA